VSEEQQPLGPTGHSIVGMSVLERRLGCPGSANAERGLPEPRVALAAERGTALHEAAAKALISGVWGDDVWEEDEEGVEIIDEYLRVVRGIQQRLGGKLVVEHRFHLAALHPELFGTADAVVIAPPVIAVADLKTGRGHRVEVRRPDGRPNLQLAGYGLGGLEAVPAGQAISAMELHVVQPLNGSHTTTTLDEDEIMDIAGDISGIVHAALSPDAPRIAGAHCRWCKAASTCPALQAMVATATDVDFADIVAEGADALDAPSEMSPERIAQALHAADAIDLWISAVRQHAYAEASQGRVPPGFKLVERKGRRKWKTGEDEQARIRRLLHNIAPQLDFLKPPTLITPTQAESVLKKAKVPLPAPEVWSSLINPGNTGITLVPDTDPRPQVQRGADADFADDPLA
jgi:hypothetical protein